MQSKTFYGLTLLAIVYASPAQADMFEELSELKKICDAGLLEEQECKERRAAILESHSIQEEEWFCNYFGESAKPEKIAVSDESAFSETASASSIVKEILDEAGLAPNFIVRPANVSNATASARGGQRYVEYNPSFVSNLKIGTNTNWSVYSVMAHEIGHHLQGHTLIPGGSRPNIELEADEYSGFILAKLGSSLSEAQAAMRTNGSNASSGTHPPTEARLDAIKNGWERSKKATTSGPQPQPTGPVVAPPPSITYTESCIVNGDEILIASNGAIISKTQGYSQVGQKIAPAHPNCVFDMMGTVGRFCVTQSGSVHFGTPVPVGQCRTCADNMCN